MLAHLLGVARDRGCTSVHLETGSMDYFAAARRLYARHGFVETAPFGDYAPDPLSTFMVLRLSGPSPTTAAAAGGPALVSVPPGRR